MTSGASRRKPGKLAIPDQLTDLVRRVALAEAAEVAEAAVPDRLQSQR